MTTNRPRKAAAVLVLVSLLCAAVPAAAAPERDADGVAMRRPLVTTLMTWLGWAWPTAGSWGVPEGIWESLGSGGDPNGAPRAAEDEPTVHPQLGSGADPDG